MSNKVNLHLMPTGVPGLDTLLTGGIARYSFVVLTGAPGSGKTTLAHQIMFNLASEQRKALFFTILGEPPLKMLRFQQQYAFFDAARVGPAIKYVNLADDLQKSGFAGVLQRILAEVQNFQPELIFVDSFKSVVQATDESSESMASLQYFVQQLGVQLSTWQATTFLIGEYADSTQEENPIFTVADGVIHLCQHLDENAVVRKVRVVKMRGTPHMPGLHSFRITDAGLHVYPRLLSGGILPDVKPGVRVGNRRVSTGSLELDGMLGGGIPVGFSAVVTGPSGAGKTVLATSFLKAGAEAGEHGIIASYESAYLDASNTPLQGLIQSGKVTDVRPHRLDLSIEEVVTDLAEAVDRTGATRLVIDSLSALELVLAPQFRHNFQESLFRMLSSLHARGVTVLMVRNLTEAQGQMFSPSSYIVDCIISMRYVELKNKLIKIISVPKLRGSTHSNEVLTFETFADHIRIAGPLD
ncbi:AAA family ATPase [Massilia sp. PAMC28688]|uniref:ATPase domain-containing protein n=1 Tax=Massilia sp. PAMC28688 TaxID=2861283 RepID=UPI001C62AF26|nr:ATPase domain-containing protein [Massilia sp. PAMC28688]QYF95492.1 AAA family ATPase [Massilia sp. PAMC28688]